MNSKDLIEKLLFLFKRNGINCAFVMKDETSEKCLNNTSDEDEMLFLFSAGIEEWIYNNNVSPQTVMKLNDKITDICSQYTAMRIATGVKARRRRYSDEL